MTKELNKNKEEVSCGLAHAEDVAKTRDSNVARINVSISSKRIEGVILDGGSPVNVIAKSLTKDLGQE